MEKPKPSGPERIYRYSYGMHMDGTTDVAWVTLPNSTTTEYVRSDIAAAEVSALEAKHLEEVRGAILYGYRAHDNDPYETSEESVVEDYLKSRKLSDTKGEGKQ